MGIWVIVSEGWYKWLRAPDLYLRGRFKTASG